MNRCAISNICSDKSKVKVTLQGQIGFKKKGLLGGGFQCPPQWLERPPGERKVLGSIPVHKKPKSLKLVVVAFPLWLRIMGTALRLARQCQDNRLVMYWLKLVQETWICDLLLLNN